MPSHSHTRGTMNITGGINCPYVCFSANHGTGALKTGASNTPHYGANNAAAGYSSILNFNAADSWSGSTSEKGNSVAHNNLQPYLSVFIWKRTA